MRLRLAVGSVKGWTMGHEVLVPSNAIVSTLVPMGRLIACGCKFEWLPDGTELIMPDGTEIEVRIWNEEPYVSQSALKLLKNLCSDVPGKRPELNEGEVQPATYPQGARDG